MSSIHSSEQINRVKNLQIIENKIQNICNTCSEKSTTINTITDQETKNQTYINSFALNNKCNNVEWVNGLIVIQDQNQLIEYIENYKPQQKTFDMQKLSLDENLKIIKYKNGIYYGIYINQMKEKQGLMIYYNGRIYEGEWKNNLRNGKGLENYPDGSKYEGYIVNGKKQGKGQFKWINGEIYDGEWFNGYKHGSGMWKGQKGDSYIGEWKVGKADGYGVHTWINGDRYEGEFKDCLKHGLGTERFSNGEIYLGNYYLGKPEGYGEYYWVNGNIYKGFFSNGLRHGRGLWQSQQEGGDVYKGYYRNDKKCGQGEYQWVNGNVYKGSFQNDLRHGYGEMIYNDGTIQKGMWINGKLQQNDKNNNSQQLLQEECYNQKNKKKEILIKQVDISADEIDNRLPSLSRTAMRTPISRNKIYSSLNHNSSLAFPQIQTPQKQFYLNDQGPVNLQCHRGRLLSKQSLITEPNQDEYINYNNKCNNSIDYIYNPNFQTIQDQQYSRYNNNINRLTKQNSLSPKQINLVCDRIIRKRSLLKTQKKQNSVKPIWKPAGVQQILSKQNYEDNSNNIYF